MKTDTLAGQKTIQLMAGQTTESTITLVMTDGPYDRSRNDGIYDRSRNEDVSGRSGSGQSYRGPGTMTWRGRVDDYVELIIQGNRDQEKGRLADSQRAGEFLQSTTKGRCRRICTKAKWSRPRVRCAATEPIKQLHGHRQNR